MNQSTASETLPGAPNHVSLDDRRDFMTSVLVAMPFAVAACLSDQKSADAQQTAEANSEPIEQPFAELDRVVTAGMKVREFTDEPGKYAIDLGDDVATSLSALGFSSPEIDNAFDRAILLWTRGQNKRLKEAFPSTHSSYTNAEGKRVSYTKGYLVTITD